MNGFRPRRRLGIAALLVVILLAEGGRAAPQQTSLEKTGLPDRTPVGGLLTYTITVSSSTSAAFTVSDRLSSAVVYRSGKVSRRPLNKTADCVHKSGLVRCYLSVPAGGRETATIVVSPIRTGPIVNRASALPYDWDPDAGRPSPASDSMVSGAVTPLGLSMTAAPAVAAARNNLTYTLVATNCAGCPTVYRAAITDSLPPGVKLVSATSTRGACTDRAQRVSCPIGTLAAGARVTADIVVVPSSVGTIANEASVTGSVLVSKTYIQVSESAGIETRVEGADLALSMRGPKTVAIGRLVAYLLRITNRGKAPASDVTLTDTLPDGVIVDSAELSQLCSRAVKTITCKLASIPSGQSTEVRIAATANSVGTLTNQARVGTSTLDTDTTNNDDEAVTTVEPAADLSVVGSDKPDPVEVGKPLTYTLAVTNDGPSDATGVQLTSSLSADVTSASFDPQGSCSRSGRMITCRLGTITKAGVTVTVEVTPGSAGTLTNRVALRSSTRDTNESNNTPEIDTAVRRTEPPPSVSIGDIEVEEGEPASLEVTLSEPARSQVSVSYQTLDGTATEADGDYEQTSGTLVFRPGETEQTIAVTAADDGRDEQDEVFSVRLRRPKGATIGDAVAQARIRDKDEQVLPALTIGDIEVEEGEPATLQVTRSEPTGSQVSVSYQTRGRDGHGSRRRLRAGERDARVPARRDRADDRRDRRRRRARRAGRGVQRAAAQAGRRHDRRRGGRGPHPRQGRAGPAGTHDRRHRSRGRRARHPAGDALRAHRLAGERQLPDAWTGRPRKQTATTSRRAGRSCSGPARPSRRSP